MRRLPLRIFFPLALAAPFAASASADCTSPTGVYINEVRYLDGASPTGERMNALVELYNKGAAPVALDGWTITDAGANVRFAFPTLSLPAQAFVVVEFGTGATDLDFGDGVGRVATNGDSVQIFDPVAGGVGLFAGAPSVANARDFVAWSADGAPAAGTAASHAIAAGLWPGTETIAVTDSTGLHSIRLWPDGVDDGDAASWNVLGWGESDFQSAFEGPNPAQIEPLAEAGVEPGPTTFRWSPTARAGVTYRLIVATDPGLAGGIVADVLTASTDTSITLVDGAHYWTVRAVDGCGESPAPVWTVDVFAYPTVPLAPGEALAPQAFGSIPMARIKQHKDTRLLCLYDARLEMRPGCTRFAGNAGPWDAAHPEDHATTCPHCGWYCVRASSKMIATHFGGNVSMDRIAMGLEQVESRTAQPEKNLQHRMGVWSNEIEAALEFSLTGENVTAYNATYALIKSEIQAGYPMLVTRPGHAMVCTGYLDAGTLGPGRPAVDMIRIVDPWPARPAVRYQSLGASQVTLLWSVRPLSGQTIAGRNDEAEMTMDTDGDGIVDFDEGAPNYPMERPRRLQSRHDDPDTDNDDLFDKVDIALYTFHTCLPNDSLTFPDRDGDGARGEADCDSDNGGQFDGGENTWGNATCNAYTDPYNAADDGIAVATDKALYFIGETVSLGGARFHADTTYGFANIPTCPDLMDEQAIGGGGALTTNGFGVMPFQPISMCEMPGVVLTVVDVLRNSTYEEPDCQNPWTCWTCLAPIITLDLDDEGEWEDLDKIEYVPATVPWQWTTDFMHTGTGYHAELNGPGNPGTPINTALRLPGFAPAAGDQVFLTYWTAFFSQNMQGTVRLSTDGGNQWTTIQQYGPPQNQFSGVEAIDITPYLPGPVARDAAAASGPAGIPILVEFLAMGPPASGGWFLDDFGVGSIPEGTVSAPAPDRTPDRFRLSQNNPNPFSATTSIAFDVPREAGRVKLDVYDVAGRRVRTLADGALAPGRHVRFWDGRDASGAATPAGIYFYRLTGTGWEQVRRMSKIVP